MSAEFRAGLRIVRGFVSVLIAVLSCYGQETRGLILGRVVDTSGAVVVGATVKATNIATGVPTSGLTNQTGDYALQYLIPGTYNVTADLKGFKSFSQEAIPVRIADKITINITLPVGEISEKISVVGQAPLIEAASASMGAVVDNRRIMELPLKDGNPIMLANLAPGVTNLSTGTMMRPFDNGSPSSIVVNGSKSGTQEFTMDGAPNMQRGSVAYIPPPGVVEEFKIQSTTFDASFGFSAGAVINVSLKSGTNELHGGLYSFLQNPALMAKKFFDNRRNLPKSPIRQNRWGVHAGGPVMLPKLYNGKNRTFWIYGYEGIRDDIGTWGTQTVSTLKQRQGDFSDLLKIGPQYQIYDPATIAPAPNGRFSRQPFAGNVIPPGRISPAARKFFSYLQNPNLPGTVDGLNNLSVKGQNWDRYYTHVFRIDHEISERQRFFVRGDVNWRIQHNATPWQPETKIEDGFDFYRKNRGLAVDHVYVFSPTFLLNSRYSYTRFIEINELTTRGIDPAVGLELSPSLVTQIRQVDPRAVRFPTFSIEGSTGTYSGSYYLRYSDTHDLAANFTRAVRSHTFRFGTGYRVYRHNRYDFGQSAGQFQFGTNWTRGPLDTSGPAPNGQGVASFLLGLPTGGSIDVNGSYAEQNTIWAAYFQDDWKITSRLTVNFGIRYETEGALTERFNRSIRQFDPVVSSPIEPSAKAKYAQNPILQLAPEQFRVLGGLRFAGVDGAPRTLWNRDKNNFAPRIGFAYAFNPKTVVRGGYGIFFDLIGISRQDVNQAGFSKATDFVASLDNGQTFIANLTNPFPNGFERPAGSQLGLMTFVGQGISFFNSNIVNPYAQRWQLSIQRQLGRQMVVEVAYVGSRGTKLRTTRQLDPIPRQYLSTSPVRDQATINFLNAAVPNPFYPLLPKTSLAGTTVTASQLLRPYPEFAGIGYTSNQGYSWYHSMQTRFEKRFSAGYTFNIAWTWSKLMEAISYLNETDPLPEKVISSEDRTHRFVATGVYEFPFGRGKRWGAGQTGFTGKAISGWQVQGIYQGQSGPALGFGNAIFTGNLKNISLSKSERTVDRWFNVDAGFERLASKQLLLNIATMSTRFSGVRGDGLNMWDLSAIKNTTVNDKVSVQFRAEFLNGLNHVQFNAPNTTPSSSAFGTITSEGYFPRLIQFGLKILF